MGAKLTQCPNGHYYDAEQYTSCPYCQSVTSNSFNDTDRDQDMATAEMEMMTGQCPLIIFPSVSQ